MNKKKSSENDQLTGHFQGFFCFVFIIFRDFFSFLSIPRTLNLKKSPKSTNKKNLV